MKKTRPLLVSLFICGVFCTVPITFADVMLPSVLGENMVLQRDMNVTLWGWADPGEKVTVSIERQTAATNTDRTGKWHLTLNPMEAGGPYTMTIRGNNTITLQNIFIGEVWVCSGQSNMEMMVQHCENAPGEVADADYPNIRLFQIKNAASPEPLDDCEGEWKVCRPSTVGNFSAAGYFFGREIMKTLDVPVGIIHASWGGTTAEGWMSVEALTSNPDYRYILYRWDEVMREKSPEIVDYYRQMGEWHEDLYHMLYADRYRDKPLIPPGHPPEAPVRLGWLPQIPTWLHNAMIRPVIPFAIRGVIWYQGESNAGRAYQYRSLFPALITDWRRLWGQGDFPFVYVQIANYGEQRPEPAESAWAELREAQLMTLSLPNTAMAVTIDIGDADDIHPKNKQEVGQRLVLGALNIAYHEDIVHSGPVYESMTVEDGRIRLRFTHTGSGLTARTGESLRGFDIAGEDKRFVRGRAVIMGDEVVVWSDEVSNPVAVRYAWANNPDCNLYNREGLPASPFRTDDWPGITAGKR